MDHAEAVVAVLFAVVTGMNDGGAILTTGLKLRGPRTWAALAMLSVAVAVVPLTLGTAVAATFGSRLVSFGGATAPVTIGVLAALAVVVTLTRLGRPTSLTLATVGGLTGSGLGYGLPVSLGWVGYVLALGVAAPFVGGAAAFAISHALARVRSLTPVHRVGLLLQCVAYAANDGQKMLAVFAIALASRPDGLTWRLAAISVLFAVGTLLGLPRAGRSLGGQVLSIRPVHAVSAELAAAGAVLACAALGVPVSMTQSLAGGLIGAGVTHGPGRVRWHATTKIALAWLLTLPASVALAALAAAALR